MHIYEYLLFIFVACILLKQTNSLTIQYVTDLTVNTTATDTDVKTEVLNWIQSLNSIEYFSSIYKLSNVTILQLAN